MKAVGAGQVVDTPGLIRKNTVVAPGRKQNLAVFAISCVNDETLGDLDSASGGSQQ